MRAPKRGKKVHHADAEMACRFVWSAPMRRSQCRAARGAVAL